MTTANGQYLEQFVFNPGGKVLRSKDKFPQESLTKKDWEVWFNFWHDYTDTGDKLHTPLGTWMAPHRRWIWYYESSNNDLHQIENRKVHHYSHTMNYQRTRSTTNYELVLVKYFSSTFKRGAPTSIVNFTNTNVNKLNKGAPLAKGPCLPTDF